VLLNNQQGGFTLGNTVTTPGNLVVVMLADLNGDGNLDAVVNNDISAYVYLGNGQGGFTAGVGVGYPGLNLRKARFCWKGYTANRPTAVYRTWSSQMAPAASPC
jgi:hypothetical protein